MTGGYFAPARLVGGMGRWLTSGLRRDVCAVIDGLERPTGQECKAALEDHYGERVTPRTFYGALDALVEAGHLRADEDGIHDRYALTEAGERALAAHREWLCSD